MPVPIRPNKNREENNMVDYSFLATMDSDLTKKSKIVTASDEDATLLFELWKRSETIDDGVIKLNSDVNSKDLLRLKNRGYLIGDVGSVSFTKKGKMVITTMTLAEPNNFSKERKEKNYNEILASMDKRGKKGYRIPKFAASNSNFLRLS